MKGKNRIKAKIQALLQKTTENGASQEEALPAIVKAQVLMKQHMIDENDLKDPYLTEKCVTKFCPRIKSSYDLTIILYDLCNAFDCEHYYNKERIAFFGFEEDVNLCVYFYQFILKSCMKAKDEYKKSSRYYDYTYKLGYHGRTLVASFIKGFQITVCRKLDTLYKDRTSQYSQEVGYGLVVVEKKKRVNDEFNSENPTLKIKKSNLEARNKEAFNEGADKGSVLNITQGVNEAKKSSNHQISLL